MVWGLFPADPLPGEDKYFIFSKGTYKVGRKGCDVIVNKDKGVSRIHAELVIDAMTSSDHLKKKSSVKSSNIRIRDCSKYGTFINKNLGSKEKVHEFPNKETTLEDGDLVSFGTGNATYRFCFVPLSFYCCHLESFQANKLLQGKIASIGASVTCNWSPECTHVLVDDFMPLIEVVVDAIVAKIPFVRYDWLEFIAEKKIGTEIPSCTSYAPTLNLEGVSVKVADPKSRENCLRGYTFLLESTQKYKVKDKLQLLLEVVGAKVVLAEEFCPTSQGVEDEGNDHVVRVIPAGLTDTSEGWRSLSSLPRVNEMTLILATLSGHLDPSALVSAPVLVTSSCSTDETVVADSDAEVEITSVHTSCAIQKTESVEDEGRRERTVERVESVKHEEEVETTIHSKESLEHERKKNISRGHANARLKNDYFTSLRDTNDCTSTREHKFEESESGTSDIIYSQDLIVRDTGLPTSVNFPTNNAVVNFKRFRKMGTQSGNSFDNLIPFSKYPYNGDSEYGNEDAVQSVKEEKKRKQMEAAAEELFNNEKGKRRGVTGSLHGIFARR